MANKLIETITKIVYQILNKEGLIGGGGEWHLGKVKSVVDSKKLEVYVDGSSISQIVPCNPSVTFAANDEIWVVFINGNSINKFAISKRGV
ncbi:hypothetical protein AB1283_25955 [Bacillus sp. S13(2024)]|uniref:hypothetical protein n=1 Tax=Bacillus sp. S13(2024) TaxID=3162885 RepID=UPI003D1F4BA4